MRLLVLRHAKSSWSDPNLTDFQRPLKKRGRRDARCMGLFLKANQLLPELVIASPAKRAKQTILRCLKAASCPKEMIQWDAECYHCSPQTWLRLLRNTPTTVETLMLVGHEPGLSDFIIQLTGEKVAIPDDGKLMPTAALAQIELGGDWGEQNWGMGQLHTITRPRLVNEEGKLC